ncbi:MAG: 2OG-Fe(II) oxygenase [Thiotrichales bacterium]|nr:2OG-Fe(II) oxygenase [Thiotrichales bacterium]
MPQLPETISSWLTQNKQYPHHLLINLLLQANYTPENAVLYCKLFFAEDFAADPHQVHPPARRSVEQALSLSLADFVQVCAPNPMTETTPPKADDLPSDSKPFFAPNGDFGPTFPNALQAEGVRYPITGLCHRPRAFQVLNVLSVEECQQLIAESRHQLQPSTVATTDQGTQRSAVRTSYGAQLAKAGSPLVRKIEQRLAQLFHFPSTHGEPLQILKYAIGAEYKPHLDYFDPKLYQNQYSVPRCGNRVATIILYLNEPELGGSTIFPKAQLDFMPIQGSAVYFDYCNAEGELDPKSLHGGTPVLAGEKWIATQWVRMQPW